MIVGYFSECYHPIRNGVVVSIETAVRGLAARGVETIVVAPRFPGYQDADHTVYRFPSLTFPVRPTYPVPVPLAPRLYRRLAALPFDLIHTHSPLILGRLGARLARQHSIPVVYTYHTLIEKYSHYIPLPQRWVRAWARALTRHHAQAMACVIAPSASAATALRALGVPTRIEVIPTGVDLRLAEGARLAPVRESAGLPGDAPVLMYVGRLGREKNIAFLLEVVARISKRLPVHLALVGEGGQREVLAAHAATLGIADQVHFLGTRPRAQVLRLMAGADLFICASTTETQGLALLEAFAVGLPVVAVDASGVRETIGGSAAGIRVPHDVAAFADALCGLLRDTPRRDLMARAARARAADCSGERMAERLHALYDELV